MKWDSSFAIGIDVIDRQHEKIFEHLLAVENALAKRDPWHILRFHLAQLLNYMKLHFAVEEALLDIIKYPACADHEGEHARLVEEIGKLEDRLRKTASNEALVSFFEHWFVDHVFNSDRTYAVYIRDEFPPLYAKPRA